MDREVLFVADDFGLSTDRNAAILAAHVQGALHGASLMVGQPGTADAVGLARQHPTLQIGWHLHLCNSQPLTRPCWPWGRSPARGGWAIGLSWKGRRLLRAETAAQWEQFRRTGLECKFANVHHHLHTHPLVYRELLRALPQDWTGWLRLGTHRFFKASWSTRLMDPAQRAFWKRRRRQCPFPASDTLWGVDRLDGMQVEEVTSAIRQLPTGLHEFMFHPRSTRDDPDLACLIDLRRLGREALPP